MSSGLRDSDSKRYALIWTAWGWAEVVMAGFGASIGD